MRVDFCIPVYNEEKILKNNILKLFSYCQKQNFPFAWQIVIVVNGSDDRSLAIALNLAQKNPKIKVINLKQAGKGRAIKHYGEQSQADILVYMDVDLAVSLDNINDLIFPLLQNKADLVIGSRLLAESKINRSFVRELSSQGYNFLSRLILGHHFSDLQCGFKAIRKDFLKKIAPYIKNNHWFFDTELIVFTNLFGGQIKEIPVDWSENRYEQRKSKVNLIKDSFKFLFNLIKLKRKIRQIKKTKFKIKNFANHLF